MISLWKIIYQHWQDWAAVYVQELTFVDENWKIFGKEKYKKSGKKKIMLIREKNQQAMFKFWVRQMKQWRFRLELDLRKESSFACALSFGNHLLTNWNFD